VPKGPERRTERFTLRLPMSLRKKLEAAAAQGQRSVSDWIVLALQAAVAAPPPPPPPTSSPATPTPEPVAPPPVTSPDAQPAAESPKRGLATPAEPRPERSRDTETLLGAIRTIRSKKKRT